MTREERRRNKTIRTGKVCENQEESGRETGKKTEKAEKTKMEEGKGI